MKPRDWKRADAEIQSVTVNRPAICLRLAYPELIHAGKCIGVFILKNVPQRQVARGLVLWKPDPEFLDDPGVRDKPEELNIAFAQEAD